MFCLKGQGLIQSPPSDLEGNFFMEPEKGLF